jgi:hypothetical protein
MAEPTHLNAFANIMTRDYLGTREAAVNAVQAAGYSCEKRDDTPGEENYTLKGSGAFDGAKLRVFKPGPVPYFRVSVSTVSAPDQGSVTAQQESLQAFVDGIEAAVNEQLNGVTAARSRRGRTSVEMEDGSVSTVVSNSDPIAYSLQLEKEIVDRLELAPQGTPVVVRINPPQGGQIVLRHVKVDADTVLAEDTRGGWKQRPIHRGHGRAWMGAPKATTATPATYRAPQRQGKAIG